MQPQKDRNCVIGFLFATAIFFFATGLFSTLIAAEILSRQSQWEATLEAAKKEGKVNI